MSPLFSKLNLKAQKTVHVLHAPPSFEAEILSLESAKVVRMATPKIEFAIAFAVTTADLDAACVSLVTAAVEDAVLWIAYPKGTSKKYKCEFNRDSGWKVLGSAGYEPVRMVAIDEDWSALRFKKTEKIKSITRSPAGAISKAGKQRAKASEA